MIRRPPRSTRTDTRFPYTTLFRSLRRSQPSTVEQVALRCGDVELQPASRSVRLDGNAIELTGAEFDVLRILIEDAGQVIAKDDLSRRALNRRLGAFDRSIDMHIRRLRQKLGPHPDGTPPVSSVRNRAHLSVNPAQRSPHPHPRKDE